MAWAGIILGGGDGKRLRTLTRALTGDDRPKQFCAVVGRETLLEQTRRRARLLIPHERLLTVVTRKHERYFRPALVDAAPGTVVVQPEARGTAIAVLYALLRLEALGSTSAVAVLPSDHYVSDDGVFMTHVLSAFKIVQARRDLVVVLGIVADRPEPAYGWIQLGEWILGRWPTPLFRVGRFWEKPPAVVAERLMARGGLWNSLVLVAHPATLRETIYRALPELVTIFAPVAARANTSLANETARRAFARVAPMDLSRRVVAAASTPPAVLPGRPGRWGDPRPPARVDATPARLRPGPISAWGAG